MMLITRERIEKVLGEAVERGQVTRRRAGHRNAACRTRAQADNDVLNDLEGLLDRGRTEIEGRTTEVRKAATAPATPAAGVGRPHPRGPRRLAGARPGRPRAPRGRRGAELPDHRLRRPHGRPGPGRLTDLTPAELRKVRDYERRNANRKTVLNAIESKLG